MDFASFRLAASTADLDDEPAARDEADLLEFRMDLSTGGPDAVRGYDGSLPLLVTNRVAWEGGEADDTPARLDALAAVLSQETVTAVDVELAAVRAGDAGHVLSTAREHDVRTVVSVHDFESTPPPDTLRSLLASACEHGDIGKLAVTARSRDDVLDLLTVTRDLTAAGQRVATMAMGEAGRHSRAVAPLYGSCLGYAPVDPAAATAPGQYTLGTLRRLVDQLSGRRLPEH
ncbi:MAG: type I 3-dehydroquinate dehydratase [Halovenus sp.]